MAEANAAKSEYDVEFTRLSAKNDPRFTREVITWRLPRRVQERINFEFIIALFSDEELVDVIRFLREATEMMKKHNDWYSFRVEHHNVYNTPMQTDLFCDNSGFKKRVAG